jgi:DNA polymerase-3 subunit epsilon
MREIALDTETTGLDPASGHRVVEIGCVEMFGRVRTGEHFHIYLNPECDVPDEAFRVHGLSREFLADKPLFSAVAEQLLTFLADAPLVIHNAQFDMKFLNAELGRHGLPPLPFERAVDTLTLARKRFPGSPCSLDALCRRFNVDLSARTRHGALLDAELLADVYLELMGGRQAALVFDSQAALDIAAASEGIVPVKIPHRVFAASPEELAAHYAFLATLKNPLWNEPAD